MSRPRSSFAAVALALVLGAGDTRAEDADLAADREPQPIIERIEIRGNSQTSEQVIRHLIDLRPGDRLEPGVGDRQFMLLSESMLFGDLHIAVEPGSEKGHAVFVIVVKERKSTAATQWEFGARSPFGPYATLGVRVTSPWGRGRQLGSQVVIEDSRWSLGGDLVHPWLFWSAWDLGLNLNLRYYDEERLFPYLHSDPDVDEGEGLFRFVSLGAVPYLARDLGKHFRLRLGCGIESIEISGGDSTFTAVEGGAAELHRVSALLHSGLVFDLRTQSAAGFRSGIDFRYAPPGLFADESFLRSEAYTQFYPPLPPHHSFLLELRGARVTGDLDYGSRLRAEGDLRSPGVRRREVGQSGADRMLIATADYGFPVLPGSASPSRLRGRVFVSAAQSWLDSQAEDLQVPVGLQLALQHRDWGRVALRWVTPLRGAEPDRLELSLDLTPIQHFRYTGEWGL